MYKNPLQPRPASLHESRESFILTKSEQEKQHTAQSYSAVTKVGLRKVPDNWNFTIETDLVIGVWLLTSARSENIFCIAITVHGKFIILFVVSFVRGSRSQVSMTACCVRVFVVVFSLLLSSLENWTLPLASPSTMKTFQRLSSLLSSDYTTPHHTLYHIPLPGVLLIGTCG